MDDIEGARHDFETRIDLRQDRRYQKFVESIGFETLAIPTSKGTALGYIKRIPILGVGLLKVQRYTGEIDQKALLEIVYKNKIWRTILEPVSDPRVRKITRVNRDPFLPTKTRFILTGGNDFSQNVRRILKKDIGMSSEETGVDDFYDAWRRNSKIWTLSREALRKLKKYFGDDCILWVTKDGETIVGGILCLIANDWAYYFAAFGSKTGRDKNSGVWSVVSLLEKLRKKKIKYLDFEGIYDERFPRESWKGFSEFKSRFGGVTYELPGCFGRWF